MNAKAWFYSQSFHDIPAPRCTCHFIAGAKDNRAESVCQSDDRSAHHFASVHGRRCPVHGRKA